MEEKIDFSKPVKLKNPQEGEENLLFKVVNYNDVTDRVIIEIIDDTYPFRPQELVSIEDIKN